MPRLLSQAWREQNGLSLGVHDMTSVTLTSGMALVVVIDALRSAERPMSTKKLSLVTKVAQDEVIREVERLRKADELTVYRIADREFYELRVHACQ
jgi:hypothetical protein